MKQKLIFISPIGSILYLESIDSSCQDIVFKTSAISIENNLNFCEAMQPVENYLTSGNYLESTSKNRFSKVENYQLQIRH